MSDNTNHAAFPKKHTIAYPEKYKPTYARTARPPSRGKRIITTPATTSLTTTTT